MLGNSCRKTCGTFRLTVVIKIHTLVSGIFCLMGIRNQTSSSLEKREYEEGPWLPWWGRKRATIAFFQPSYPLKMTGGNAVKATSLQRLSYSGQTTWRTSHTRSSVLKKTTKKKRHNQKRYALPEIFASLVLIMNQGKRQPLLMFEDSIAVSKAMGEPNAK